VRELVRAESERPSDGEDLVNRGGGDRPITHPREDNPRSIRGLVFVSPHMTTDPAGGAELDGLDPGERLALDDVRGRAASGAALLGARGALIYALGIVANLALARLLVPRDFGLVALGTVLVVLGTYLAIGGLGAALIRRESAPTRIELEAITGAQLGLTILVTGLALGGAAPFGRDGFVVATMVGSLPIISVRTPAVILLERKLQYRLIAAADVAEAVAYYVWAVGTVAIGFGVWGLATAVVVRAAVGSAAMLIAGPAGFVRPRWSLPHLRPLLAFGAKFQATGALQILREQGLNVVIAAIAGISTLGVWNLAYRVLQIPNLLFLTVGRVAFPALSRLLGAGQDPRPVIERGVAALSAMTGIVVVALIGFAPALTSLIGHRWHQVPAVLVWSGMALVLAAPIGVAGPGYLFAADRAGTVAAATLASSAVWFAAAAALLPPLGATGVAIGWVAAGIVNSGMLWRRTTMLTGAAMLARVARPTVISLAAAGAGWGVARAVDPRLLGGALGLAVGEAALIAGLAAFDRSALRDTWALTRQGMRRSRTGRRAAATVTHHA